MIKLLGENYYIDLDKIESYLDMNQVDSVDSVSGVTEMKINVVKFELVKLLLETVLSEHELLDDAMGLKNKRDTTIPFKLAFNTLLNKKLINYY